MRNGKTITLDKMRPSTRIAHLCVLGLVFLVPWIAINLWLRMPNFRLWTFEAGALVAYAAVWIAFRALQRHAWTEAQATEPPPAPTELSN